MVSVDDSIDLVCCCWSSLMTTLTDSDIFLTICPEFFWSFIFRDPFLHVHLSAHRPCWALFLGTISPASDGFVVWRVDCVTRHECDELIGDKLTVWRDDRVTTWLCDELTGRPSSTLSWLRNLSCFRTQLFFRHRTLSIKNTQWLYTRLAGVLKIDM